MTKQTNATDAPENTSETATEPARRDFIYYATDGVGVVASGAAIWPLINTMNPSADVTALSKIEVDLTDIETGMRITLKWQGKPVFIDRRTQEQIDLARADAVDIDLHDHRPQRPVDAPTWLQQGREERALPKFGDM